MKLFTLLFMLLLSSCTFSINQVHTEGAATDVVDEDQRAEPVVTTSLEVPLKPL